MSAWMDHVKATKKAHPKKSLKEVLKMASKSYKKGSTMKKGKKGKTVGKKSGRKVRKTARKGRKSRGRK